MAGTSGILVYTAFRLSQNFAYCEVTSDRREQKMKTAMIFSLVLLVFLVACPLMAVGADRANCKGLPTENELKEFLIVAARIDE